MDKQEIVDVALEAFIDEELTAAETIAGFASVVFKTFPKLQLDVGIVASSLQMSGDELLFDVATAVGNAVVAKVLEEHGLDVAEASS